LLWQWHSFLFLRIEAVSTNKKSQGPHYTWGLDCIVLKRTGQRLLPDPAGAIYF
jgi:hypothetical protein